MPIDNVTLRTRTASVIATLQRARANIAVIIQPLAPSDLRCSYGAKFQLAAESLGIAIEILQTAHDATPTTNPE